MLVPMLAVAVSCADPGYCPTAGQLRQAYESWLDRSLAEKSEAFAASGQIAIFDRLPILRISEARCGKPTAGGPAEIRCTARFHYSHRRERVTLFLTRTEQGWVVQRRLGD